jgi:uncharacterized protein (TIGR02996 family)
MQEQTFLDSILAHPDDEVGRLAYADWLLESGAPDSSARGEFIQVQVQLARRAEGLGNPTEWVDAARIPEMKAREAALLAAHGKEWASTVAGLVDRYEFRRGFVEHVTIDTNRFLKNADGLFAAAPVQRVRFTGGVSKNLADSPHLARLVALEFPRTNLGDTGLRTLLASPHLTNLTTLDLSYCYLSNVGVQALAASPYLARLTHLNLAYNQLGMQAVQALYQSKYWGKVRTLVLTGNSYIDARAQQFLAQSLQGKADPALLRSLLQLASREEREYTRAEVRALAQKAGSAPAGVAEVLAEGLRDGSRKVRSAAATLLAQLGGRAAAGLPGLVQRLFDRDPRVRDQVAPALARLLPDLSAEMQTWLCVLANPLISPEANLRATLEARGTVHPNPPRLPATVSAGFAAVCARRAAWWRHVAVGGTGPAPLPQTEGLPHDSATLQKAADEVCARAAKHAGRHTRSAQMKQALGEAADTRERAWLLARLCELLQAVLPPPAPPAPAASRRRK